jgi:hypothetical protein
MLSLSSSNPPSTSKIMARERSKGNSTTPEKMRERKTIWENQKMTRKRQKTAERSTALAKLLMMPWMWTIHLGRLDSRKACRSHTGCQEIRMAGRPGRQSSMKSILTAKSR